MTEAEAELARLAIAQQPTVLRSVAVLLRSLVTAQETGQAPDLIGHIANDLSAWLTAVIQNTGIAAEAASAVVARGTLAMPEPPEKPDV